MASAPGTETGVNGQLEAPSAAGEELAESIGDGRVGFRASAQVERRTQEIGRELFDRIGRGPRPWQRGWWDDRIVAATLDDPLVRVQLFRFIDVLPALKTPDAIRRHLAEYLSEAGDRVPAWLRLALGSLPYTQPAPTGWPQPRGSQPA